jgi:phosphate starvation-inducible PhoH-like protein
LDEEKIITDEQLPTAEQATANIEVESFDEILQLFGAFDENQRIIETETGTQIVTNGNSIEVRGEAKAVETTRVVLDKLLVMIRKNEPIDKKRIRYAIELVAEGNADLIEELMGDVVAITNRGRPIKCKTINQKRYIQAIKKNTVVLGIGPAGTGKTYLAVAMAVHAFKNKEVAKIILTRPAVEAGEKLGFLPGDLQNKVDPYLRPLYDALYDFLGAENFKALSERGIIEVAPLAYMRGRTLSDAFIILDEAQNCTVEQMKMFLTRFGEGSKVVVTGDITQIDLPGERRSGLIHAATVLGGIEDIEIIYLTHKAVVRNEIVQRIIRAYERSEKRRG